MDDSISKALKKKEKLQEELARVEHYIRLHNELFGSDGDSSSPQSTGPEPEQTRRRRGKPAEIADAAEKAIRDAGRPLQRGELVGFIEGTGIEIHSDDKPRYIGTILWRQSERFVNVEGRGYWLVGVPLDGDGNQMSVFD